jgi:predicted nucleic acid-binding protein
VKYLLNFCSVSHFVKGQPNVLARVKATSPTLIAGTGLARGLVLVASNVREFKRVSGLTVEN